MARKIVVENQEWLQKENQFKYCKELEEGNVLLFPKAPFEFPQEEIDFLLKQKQGTAKGRKNIAYKPQVDKVTNFEVDDPQAAERLKRVLRQYSQRVSAFLTVLLEPYSKAWRLDYVSFRPFQEKGRDLRLRARNDLLHIDAFPTRPLHGSRILRFFTNINPNESRRWITSDSFSELAKQFGGEKGVPFPRMAGRSLLGRLERKMKRFLGKMGISSALRSPYDTFMLQLHHFMKENGEFQEKCPKESWEFPPHCCWAVYTDQVSHAALSGQYALEQTLFIPVEALLYPEKSPVRVLELLAERSMLYSSKSYCWTTP